jgi:ketosteroid isomerase-like protein
MKQLLPLFLLFLLPYLAQSQVTPAAVEALENRWTQALITMDTIFLNQYYHPQLVYTHSGGTVDDKTSWMSSFKKGTLKYIKLEPKSMRVDIYGKTAIATYLAYFSVQNNGSPLEFDARVIHVLVHDRTGWRLVAHQTTRLPKP